ncbi:MAG: response regulator, partial [Syntrophaceae bacterium]|nr:response regulator [Syntrophaceae bacterium]
MSAKTKPNDTTEILVVEDSPTQAEQLRYLLEQHHYTVTMAQNGEQALAFVEEHKPSLVISDIVMPEMNGYELCQRIKADERTQAIPVILLTSLSDSSDVLEGLACGADSFITKPYGEDYLLMQVERVLAGRTPRPGGRAGIEVEIPLAGKSRVITAHPQQMLSLLLSNYEAAVHRNTELAQTQEELSSLNEHLEDLVEERTAALSAEIAERKQAEKLKETLFDIANIANSAASLEELYRSIHASIGELVPAENFYIAIYDPDKDENSFPYFVDQYDSPPSPKKTGRGLTEYVLRSGNPLLAPPEVFESLVRQGEVELVGENSVDWLGVPLRVGDKTVGVMVVQSYTETVRFGQREMDILTFVSSQVAMVVERKRAEASLRESEEKFKTLFNSANDAIFTMNHTTFLDCNVTTEKIFRCSKEQIVGHSPVDFSPERQPDGSFSSQSAVGKIEAAFAGEPQFFEWLHTHLDGTPFDAEVSLNRVFIGGEFILQAIVRDITERKQAEELIQKQVETLGALYDLSRTLAEMEDFNAILDLLTRCAVETTHVTFARVLLLENGDLVARAAFPIRMLDQDLQVGQREPLAAHPLYQRILEESTPRVLQLEGPEAGECAPFFLGIAQTLCVIPLRARERPLGLLMLGEARAAAREPFTADKIHLAHNIGDQAASTLHRALLHEETQRRLQNIEALRAIDHAISSSLDLRLTLNVALEQTINQLGVDAAAVLLLNPHNQTLEYAAGRGFRGKAIERTRLRLGEGHAGRAALERR